MKDITIVQENLDRIHWILAETTHQDLHQCLATAKVDDIKHFSKLENKSYHFFLQTIIRQLQVNQTMSQPVNDLQSLIHALEDYQDSHVNIYTFKYQDCIYQVVSDVSRRMILGYYRTKDVNNIWDSFQR